MKHEIQIEAADETTGNLVLKIEGVDADEIQVGRLTKVTWSIAAPNVYSFRIEENKGSEQIFTERNRPSSEHAKSAEGRVRLLVKKNAVYNYSIWWRSQENSKELQHDPKISVKPSLFF